MNLQQRAETFNQMLIDDARNEYGLTRHKLTYPERKPIPVEMLNTCAKRRPNARVQARSGAGLLAQTLWRAGRRLCSGQDLYRDQC